MTTLNQRQHELLRWLDDEKWRTPMELGGRDGSHHSNTLMWLVKRGFAETKKIHAIYCMNGTHYVLDAMTGESKYVRKPITACCCKGHRRYRRTKAGRDYILGEITLDAMAKTRDW